VCLAMKKFGPNQTLNCDHNLHLSWLDVWVFDIVNEPRVLRVVVQQHSYAPIFG
jgi:hypothetical protein